MKRVIKRFQRRLNARRRPIVAMLAAIGMFMGVFGGGTAALAASASTDSLSAVLYSSDRHAAVENPGKPAIQWNSGSSIVVEVNIDDLSNDGKGPTLVIQLFKSTKSGGFAGSAQKVYELRNTTGNTVFHTAKSIPWPNYGSGYVPALQFDVCNGKSASGGNLNCRGYDTTYLP